MECLRNNFNAGVVLGGRYQTVSPLNHGSFGLVFMAKDLETDEMVAIKCLTKNTAADEAGLAFAIDERSEELALHSRLGQHPNIVNLLTSFETDAHVYLVLEFCPNGDLYEAIMAETGPKETEHVRRFMFELIDAVSYLHSKGIYHRDIKPENIFLTSTGSMKLGDFGLATTETFCKEPQVGSDRYMSPEQWDPTKEADPDKETDPTEETEEDEQVGYSPAQADIWAIGICLLNILFKRNPFTQPTEADPIFVDFFTDKQSLFDVFPRMSHDTFEVIVQCMHIDPSQRSLEGAREALERVVSFTTLDETLDEFCTAERRVVASANREPLRTPSIQSPQLDTGAFPWAKALHASPPKPIRQLSAIPDNEDYAEDLFSKSGGTTDWLSMSGRVQTPSLSSFRDVSLAASMQSLNIPARLPVLNANKASPMAGSLPISMAKPRNQSAISLVFGRKDAVSKSWSDMWDEEAEEEERARQLETLKGRNARTWSHDSSASDDDTPRLGLSPAMKSAAVNIQTETPSVEAALAKDLDEDLAADGFFFHDAPPVKEQPVLPTRYSPPSKRNGFDKWAALGERRRAYTGNSETLRAPESTLNAGRQAGNDIEFGSIAHGVSDSPGHTQHHKSSVFYNHHNHSSNVLQNVSPNNAKWNTHNTVNKDRAKECPWNKGRERDWNWNLNWRKEKRHDIADVEWVGGWQESHP